LKTIPKFEKANVLHC